ncbi:auxin-binding protein [Chondromyces apiculatus DSM 436]|uniref:Auxin-binding protein n=1 Tax=Chondromyces apiculatus DSM 436 TaxID=1192034 RepID=A0A017TDT2_9BACT|nr:auxin-binding protein [Chondromyces apiculatus DSM 436]
MRRGAFAVLTAFLAAFLVAGVGCDGGDDDGEPTTSTTTVTGGVCEGETRSDVYSAGMEVPSEGGSFSVRLVEATPGPPAKGENSWTLLVLDGAGQAVEGVTLTVTPWMPDHNHGSPAPPTVRATVTPGEYEVSAIDLIMAGFWEVTVDIAPEGGEPDSAVFGFCVEG